jgi:hypothetical protein
LCFCGGAGSFFAGDSARVSGVSGSARSTGGFCCPNSALEKTSVPHKTVPHKTVTPSLIAYSREASLGCLETISRCGQNDRSP